MGDSSRRDPSTLDDADHKEYDDILEDYPSRFVEVDRAWYGDFLGYAVWFYESEEFPVRQFVIPDKRRRYPWESGYDMTREVQPLLISQKEAAKLGVPAPSLDWRDDDG